MLAAALLLALPALGADSTTLTDKIYQGSGTIDLLKNVSPDVLTSYLTSGGSLLFGIDVNENASGNESSLSQGIALKSVNLVIITTAGTYTFGDFFTNTTAAITPAGAAASQEYYTVFGSSGSSQITGSTSSFDLAQFDDVISLNGVVFEGQILSAQLDVQFLQTAKNGGESESFFDYSGGFEDFALLNLQDAQTLEVAGAGLADAPSTVSYTVSPAETSPITASLATDPSSGGAPLPVPAAPAPPLLLLAGAAMLAVGLGFARARRGKGNATPNPDPDACR